MEQTFKGGMLYQEVQESRLCGLHCVKNVLQGPFFSEIDLAVVASDLDGKEHKLMLECAANSSAAATGEAFSSGDYHSEVLQKALEVWTLQVIPFNSPGAEPAQIDPELENAFICHLHDHWFCIRKVNGEWYNFNSLLAAPKNLSNLSAYLDSLKGSGCIIFSFI